MHKGHDGTNIKLLHICCPFMLEFITQIVNYCLENGLFPYTSKEAGVLPIPKNSDPEEYRDLRSISILTKGSRGSSGYPALCICS